MALAAVITTSLFDARWINPIWEFAGLDTSFESAVILATVKRNVDHFGPINFSDLDVSDIAFPEASWVPRSGRARATMDSAVRTGSFLCSILIEQAFVGQGILVLSFFACFWSLQPTSSDVPSSTGGDPSDAGFNTGVEGSSEASSGVAELSFWQADLIRPASAASSVADSLATEASLQIAGGGSEGSIALTTSAVMVEEASNYS